MLMKCNDPPCPKCGCPQSDELSRGAIWGGVQVKRQCGACDYIWWFSAGIDPGTLAPDPYGTNGHGRPNGSHAAMPHQLPRLNIITCPRCESTRTKVSRSMQACRYHKCLACGFSFKTTRISAK